MYSFIRELIEVNIIKHVWLPQLNISLVPFSRCWYKYVFNQSIFSHSNQYIFIENVNYFTNALRCLILFHLYCAYQRLIRPYLDRWVLVDILPGGYV